MKYTNLLENRVINACHFLICPTRQRGFVMRMIMMVVLVEVLTITDFCFCTFRKLYFHGKEESRQTYFKLGFYQKATREEDKHSPQGAFPFSLFSQPSIEGKEYSTVTQCFSHKIPNVANLFLVSYKQLVHRAFFNRSHILHVGFFSSLLAMPSLFFLCSTSMEVFFLTESSCVLAEVTLFRRSIFC